MNVFLTLVLWTRRPEHYLGCSVGLPMFCGSSQASAHLVLSLLQTPTKMSAQSQRFAGAWAGLLRAVVKSCGSTHALIGLSHICPAVCSWPASFLSYNPTWSLGPKRLESVLQRTRTLVCTTCSCAFVTFSWQVP